ncbi:MAG: AAA family ATPase [Thermomicrobiales bacterium]
MSGSRPNFSTLLDELMTERNVSIDQLERASGVSRSTIYRWREGRVGRAYTLGNLLRIARSLGLDRITTSRLVQAAGHAPLDRLQATVDDPAIQELLDHWKPTAFANLPAELTSFIGRDDELMRVADLLHRQGIRLVTLTGPGGSGKTRLAQRVASELQDAYPGGLLYVELSNVLEPAGVLPAIARRAGLREAIGVEIVEQLAGHFGRRKILLVLDNFEQIIDAGRDVVELLESAPGLSVLVTSRNPLHVRGETAYPVAPFDVPPEGASNAELAANPAISLFIARATAADATLQIEDGALPVIREICGMLDGIPLAIELAAARSAQYRIAELLDLFPTALSLAVDGPRDADARQQTLRGTIAWSWDLLDQQERKLLTRLGIFAGDWYGDAAGAICSLPGDESERLMPGLMSRLVSANLVQRFEDSGHYGFLQTIREYAVEQLEASLEHGVLAERHAHYFLKLAEERPYIYVPGLRRIGNLEWIDRNFRNIRAALEWSLHHDKGMLVRFAAALWPYWHEYGAFAEGRGWIAEALGSCVEIEPRLRAEILTGELLLAFSVAEHDPAREAGEEALDIWVNLGDDYGQAVTLLYLGQSHFLTGDMEHAGKSFVESLNAWRRIGYAPGIARCMNEIGILSAGTAQTTQAMQALQEAQGIYEREEMPEGVARCLIDQGLALMIAQRPDLAIPPLEQGLAIARELRSNTLVSFGLFYLGASLIFARQLEAARAPLVESLRLRYEARDRYGASYTLLGFAALAALEDSDKPGAIRAARLSGAAIGMLERAGIVMNPGMQGIYNKQIGKDVQRRLGEDFDREFNRGTAAAT